MNKPIMPPHVAQTLLAQPVTKPRFHKFQLGDIACIALADGGIPVPMPTPDGPPNFRMVQLSCLLLQLPGSGELVLLDSGFGPHAPRSNIFLPSVGHLFISLEQAGIAPQHISTVLLSHLHPDHCGGLYDDAGKKLFPRAKYYAPQDEINFWSKTPLDLSAADSPPPLKADMTQAVERLFSVCGNDLTGFAPGAELRPGITALHLPGHAPAQCGFVISSQGQNLVYTGDAFSNLEASISTPAEPSIVDMFRAQAAQTRLALLAKLQHPGWHCFAPHFPWPNFGRLEGTPLAAHYVAEDKI